MNGTDPQGNTSKIRMIASDVVQQQSRVCAVKLENIGSKLDDLTKEVQGLTKVVGAVEKQTIRLDGRWRLFTVVAGIVGVIGTIAGIIGTLVAVFG